LTQFDALNWATRGWADSIPKLVQGRLIDSFENYDLAHAPLRTTHLGQPNYQLLIAVRRVRI
jgi:phospholipid/cholesterol/gamma-HCH transport system substrate-binding protein